MPPLTARTKRSTTPVTNVSVLEPYVLYEDSKGRKTSRDSRSRGTLVATGIRSQGIARQLLTTVSRVFLERGACSNDSIRAVTGDVKAGLYDSLTALEAAPAGPVDLRERPIPKAIVVVRTFAISLSEQTTTFSDSRMFWVGRIISPEAPQTLI